METTSDALSIGAQLAVARRARRQSISDVSQQTKIQPWVLEALEADALQGKMSPVYARGFLITYARFLRLDHEPLLAQLTAPKEPVVPEEPPQAQIPPPAPAVSFKLPSFRLPSIKMPAVRLPAWKVPAVRLPSWKMPAVRLPSIRMPALRIPSVRMPWDLLRRLTPPAVVIAGVAAMLVVKPWQRLPKMVKMPKISVPHQEASVSVIKPALPAAPPKVTPKTLATIPVPKPLEVSVVVNGPTWIRVRADGKLLAQERLRRGEQETWTAAKQLELVVAKPSQVDLMLNGRPISPIAVANHGRLLITHTGISALPDEQF